MSDLDQLLTETFERRAARAATTTISPEVVRYAIRRRARTATMSALGVAATDAALATAGAIAVHGSTVRSDVGTVAKDAEGGTIIASVPWTAGTRLTVRTGTGSSTGGGAEFCLPGRCLGPANLTGGLSFGLGADLVGMAPAGTAKVRVSVGDAPPVSAPLSTVHGQTSGSPVLFGVPGVIPPLDSNGMFSQTLRVTALNGQGKAVAEHTWLGSLALAAAHPPSGAELTLPKGGAVAQVVWASRDGWTCIGERPGPGHPAYEAQSCAPRYTGSELAQLADGGGQINVLVLVGAPNIASMTLVARHEPTHDGLPSATLTTVGQAKIVVVSTADGSQDSSLSLDTRDGTGKLVGSGLLSGVAQLPGLVSAGT
jgi:hypothetical protein